MSFLGEIKRRKVFQVAAVYAVVSWLLVQVITSISEPLSLPDWADTLVIVLLAIGFPIAVILAWAFDLTPEGIRAADSTKGESVQIGGSRFAYITQALVLLAVGFLVADQYFLGEQQNESTRPLVDSDAPSDGVRRYSINLGPTEPIFTSEVDTEIALSSDGRRLVYVLQIEGRRQLYQRELDQLTGQPIPGTNGATSPFFSPDGDWLGFRNLEGLQKIFFRGGQAIHLADNVRVQTGGAWTSDDSIIFSASRPGGGRLHRIAADGGMPELLDVNSDVGEWEQSWPHILPGEEHLLFTVQPTNGTALDGHINLLALETGESRTLIRRAYNARYVPSGHIVFMRSGSLWAVPFDREQLEVTGPEVPVVSGVHSASNRGTAVYAFSDNGILIYMSGIDVWNSPTRQSTAVWVNRDGQEEPTAVPPGNYSRLRISPNGTHVALQDTDGSGNSDIWIYDLDRGMPLRLTFDPAVDDDPVWTPDGEYVVFWSERDGGGLFRKAANGSGSVEFLAAASTESGSFIPFSFSPDGQQLVVVTWPPPNDLWVLTFGDNQLVPLLQAETDERAAAVSPDGYWIAYEAELPAGDQIIVQPFPNVGDGMWQVTTSGGGRPFWGSTERDLFYTDYDGSIASVTLEMDIDDLNVQVVNQSTIVPLNAATYVAEKGIAPDGSRFLVHKRVGQRVATSDQTSLVVVENWFEELNRLAPPAE